jgi:hypothetical protein
LKEILVSLIIPSLSMIEEELRFFEEEQEAFSLNIFILY